MKPVPKINCARNESQADLKTEWNNDEFLKHIKTGDLFGENIEKLKTFICEFEGVLACIACDTGGNDLDVPTDKTVPLKSKKQLPLPFLMQEVIMKHVKEILRAKIIEMGRSPISSPVFVIAKPGKDGKVLPKHLWNEEKSRFLIDIREVNRLKAYKMASEKSIEL